VNGVALCQTEIEDFHYVVTDPLATDGQNLRFKIPVHQALGVGFSQTIARLPQPEDYPGFGLRSVCNHESREI